MGEQVLQSHLNAGTIWWNEEDKCYEGLASDGVVVGFSDNKYSLILYLSHHPSPSTW